MAELIDLTNKRFERWLVLSRANNKIIPSGQYKSYWLCKCDCGIIKDVYAQSLISGKSKSCGCIKELSRMPYGHASRNSVYSTYSSKSKRLKLEFKLSEPEFFKIIASNCF